MNLRRNIKRQARTALDGSWGQARIILLLLLCFGFFINLLDASVMNLMGYTFYVDGLSGFSYNSKFFFDPIAILFSVAVWVIRIIILTPLTVGMVNWYHRLTDRNRMGVSYIFWPYETTAWLRAGWASLSVGVRVAFVGAALESLPLVMVAQAVVISNNLLLSAFLFVSGLLLSVVAAVITMIYSKRFALVKMLLGENYGMTVAKAVDTSKRCTRKHCVELLMLDLSFLPWILPFGLLMAAYTCSITIAYRPYSLFPRLLGTMAVLVLFITIFRVQPYLSMSRLMFSRYLYETDLRLAQEHEDLPQRPQSNVDVAPSEVIRWYGLEGDAGEPQEVNGGDADELAEYPPKDDNRIVWKEIDES